MAMDFRGCELQNASSNNSNNNNNRVRPPSPHPRALPARSCPKDTSDYQAAGKLLKRGSDCVVVAEDDEDSSSSAASDETGAASDETDAAVRDGADAGGEESMDCSSVDDWNGDSDAEMEDAGGRTRSRSAGQHGSKGRRRPSSSRRGGGCRKDLKGILKPASKTTKRRKKSTGKRKILIRFCEVVILVG